MYENSLPIWSHAYGGPSGQGAIKSKPDDFIVHEILPFEPDGSGEHVFLHLEKIAENTEYIARLLARYAGVRQQDVSFAGMKDRHGRTRQWFSIWLPGKLDPDWTALENSNITILQSIRHTRKLKRGVLAGNEFEILIRQYAADPTITQQQLTTIQSNGFPNYYGEQRFGLKGQNLKMAERMFSGEKTKREQRSIYLSAVRSYLFNLILSERVRTKTWNCLLSGEICKLQGSNSHFLIETIDDVLLERLKDGDIHPTGVLYGKGDSGVKLAVLELESQILNSYTHLTEGLLKAGLESDRRALRVIPENFSWEFRSDDILSLKFRLPAGSYATVLLRELIEFAL